VASGQERKLRRRISSVESTKKITRAMELIAASRIVKAQQRVAAARPYSEQITEVLRQLVAAGVALDHPLLKERDVSTVGYIVLAADRGLAGAYNTSVLRAAHHALEDDIAEGRDYSLSIGGGKAVGFFGYRGYRIDEAHTGYTERPTYEDARTVASGIMSRYEEGDVDQVQLVYTRFLSVGSQKVVNNRLLPMEKGDIEDLAAEGPEADYEFEPGAEGILERLLPRYVEARVFAAMLDAAASEHAARQRAMKSATDAAEEMVKTLSVEANKIRQAGITTEIMDVVGGAEALRQS
jgi:F-type H+-transporting ATPase subunit gamma